MFSVFSDDTGTVIQKSLRTYKSTAISFCLVRYMDSPRSKKQGKKSTYYKARYGKPTVVLADGTKLYIVSFD